MELYDYILSDDCYKVRLLIKFLGLSYTARKVNVHPGKEHETAAFRSEVNPLGRIPVLVDGDVNLHDPQAILTYLALRYDATRQWLPESPATAGRVAMWLGFAGAELAPLSALRMAEFSDGTLETDRPAAALAANAALTILDDHLAAMEIAGQAWLCAAHPTIADIAIFPPVAMAPDAGVSLDVYPAVWRWIERFRHLPEFIVMPGVYPVFPESIP